jgi:parallel beta-helix repeat protein
MTLVHLPGRSGFVCFFGLLSAIFFSTAHAQQTIQVPGDAATIQAGINMANSGDTVNIAPGTYTEQINFDGKSITVQGSAAGVILQGTQNGPVVTFASGETRSAILQNVTVTGGSPTALPSAGGIFINGASPTIQNSTIENNQECGIAVINGAPAIVNNEISNTTLGGTTLGCAPPAGLSVGTGGAILLDGVSTDGLFTQITGDTIENNLAEFGSAGINVISAGLPLIQNNRIYDNTTSDRGAGIYVYGATSPSIVQNLIYNNTINPSSLFTSSGTDVGAGLNIDVLTGEYSNFPVLIINNSIIGNQLLLATGANPDGSQIFAQDQIQRLQFFNNLIIGTTSQSAINCIAPPAIGPPPLRPPPLDAASATKAFASPALTAPHSTTPTFTNNDVYDLNNPGLSPFAGACTDPTGTSGNLSTDPLFATGIDDPHPYELQLASPAVDSGDNAAPSLPSLDILGQPRIQNAKGLSTAIVDMGVYEFPGVPGAPPPPPTFTLTVNPTSATVLPGGSTTLSVTVTPSATNLGTVTFSCSGLPATITCTFSPQLTSFATTAPQTSILTLKADAPPLTASSRPHISGATTLAGLLFLPLLLAFKPRYTKRLPGSLYLTLTLLLLSTAGLSGCGKDKYISLIKPQTYNFVVQGTATNFNETQQAPVTLNVAGNYPASN